MSLIEGNGRLKAPDPVIAAHSFDSLVWGDPGAKIADIREAYRDVALFESSVSRHHFGTNIWNTHPMEVARCAILGIHPRTGETLVNPAKFISQFDQPETPFASGSFGDEARRLYQGYRTLPTVLRALAEDSFNNTQPMKEFSGHCGATGRQARSILRAALNGGEPIQYGRKGLISIHQAQTHIEGCSCCLNKITEARQSNPKTTYPADISPFFEIKERVVARQQKRIVDEPQPILPPTVGDGWDVVRETGLYEKTIEYFKGEGFSPEQVVAMYTK